MKSFLSVFLAAAVTLSTASIAAEPATTANVTNSNVVTITVYNGNITGSGATSDTIVGTFVPNNGKATQLETSGTPDDSELFKSMATVNFLDNGRITFVGTPGSAAQRVEALLMGSSYGLTGKNPDGSRFVDVTQGVAIVRLNKSSLVTVNASTDLTGIATALKLPNPSTATEGQIITEANRVEASETALKLLLGTLTRAQIDAFFPPAEAGQHSAADVASLAASFKLLLGTLTRAQIDSLYPPAEAGMHDAADVFVSAQLFQQLLGTLTRAQIDSLYPPAEAGMHTAADVIAKLQEELAKATGKLPTEVTLIDLSSVVNNFINGQKGNSGLVKLVKPVVVPPAAPVPANVTYFADDRTTVKSVVGEFQIPAKGAKPALIFAVAKDADPKNDRVLVDFSNVVKDRIYFSVDVKDLNGGKFVPFTLKSLLKSSVVEGAKGDKVLRLTKVGVVYKLKLGVHFFAIGTQTQTPKLLEYRGPNGESEPEVFESETLEERIARKYVVPEPEAVKPPTAPPGDDF